MRPEINTDDYEEFNPSKSTPYYWQHKRDDVDVCIQENGDEFEVDLVIDGVVFPQAFSADLSVALEEAAGLIEDYSVDQLRVLHERELEALLV